MTLRYTSGLLILVLALTLVACDGEKNSNDTGQNNANNTNNGENNTNNGENNTNNGENNTNNGENNGDNNTNNGENNGDNNANNEPLGGLGFSLGQEVRACEVLLRDPSGSIQGVVFGDSVTGRSMRRGERLALSFRANEDAAIELGAISFQLAPEANQERITLDLHTCFDAGGAALSGVSPEFTDL